MATGRCASAAALHPALLPFHSSWPPLSSSSSSSSPSPSCGLVKRLQCRQPSRRPSLRHSSTLRIVAQKPDIYKAMGTAVRTARDFLEAGTKLVPESVPRPLAQAGVAVLGILGISYLLQSIFSIALFILAIGGVSYYVFFFLNKDDDDNGSQGPSDSSSTDLTLEEARRIMDKYK